MRREFILFLLGIICISTFSSLLSEFGEIHVENVLLDKVVGLVGAGNFSYYQLGHKGPLVVELTSLSGDADLYISDTIRPSYETDKNNFSSVTCGRDVVKIPYQFPRPVGIGVFGHWSHSVSEYTIQVYLEITRGFSQELHLAMEHVHLGNERTEEEMMRSVKDASKNSDVEKKTKFSYLLNFLEMTFEMLVF